MYAVIDPGLLGMALAYAINVMGIFQYTMRQSAELEQQVTPVKICIWYPFECDMGLDMSVPSKPISHENGYHMHFLARNNHKFKLHNKETHN